MYSDPCKSLSLQLHHPSTVLSLTSLGHRLRVVVDEADEIRVCDLVSAALAAWAALTARALGAVAVTHDGGIGMLFEGLYVYVWLVVLSLERDLVELWWKEESGVGEKRGVLILASSVVAGELGEACSASSASSRCNTHHAYRWFCPEASPAYSRMGVDTI